MKIEWVRKTSFYEDPLSGAEGNYIPVVRLAAVDEVIREAIAIARAYVKQRRCYYDDMADFADDPKMTDEQIGIGEPHYIQAVKFLASPLVLACRERQKQEGT